MKTPVQIKARRHLLLQNKNSRFLKSENRNEIQLESAAKRNAIEIVYGESIHSNKPVFCIVD